MTLKNINGGHITIDDNSPTAQKIKDGYDFEIKEGKIIIGKIGTEINNKYQAIQAVRKVGNLTELKEILIKILELQQNNNLN